MENDDVLRRALAQFDAASYVRSKGAYKESQHSRAQEYLMRCEHCGSNRLRFNAEKHTWICWSCRRTGSTLDLIAMCERCNQLQAIDYVMGSYVGGDGHQGPLTPIVRSVPRNPLRAFPAIPWPDGVDVLDPRSPAHARGIEYLAGRGIGPFTIHQYRLGFGRVGKLKDRIVFPVYMGGKLVYWQARATWDPPKELKGDALRAWLDETKYRKTLNPVIRPEDEGGNGDEAGASEVLYHYDGVQGQPTVVIVEGPVDAIKTGPYAVGLLGKEATPPKVARLQRIRGCAQYIVYLDRGAQDKAHQLAAQLAHIAPVLVAVPPEGHDPGSLTMAQNQAVLQTAVPFRTQKMLVGVKGP